MLAALLAAVATAAPCPTAQAKPAVRRQVGDLWVSVDARRRVRGGRTEDSTIHDPWSPAGAALDTSGRAALAAYERAMFSDDATVVARPPKPWMADLAHPSLPIRWTRRLGEYLTYFKENPKGRGLMRAWLRRAGRYETHLRAILAEAGVPEDLVFVALAESGFNPTARSRVGAAGLWQFMPATGEVYGLTHDYWIDERHDIDKSTRAAGLYLKDLHTRFGTWELALAAFNAGYGLVMVSIDRHNTNDFWILADTESGLPFATNNYVPKIVAAAMVGVNRKAFNYTDADLDPLPALDWIDVRAPAKTSLENLAKKIGQDEKLIAELNAKFIRGRTPPQGRSLVRIPRASKAAFEKAYPALEQDALAWKEHTLRHGDRLADLAARLGTTERALRRANGVRDSAELTGGVVLVVPPADVDTASAPGGKAKAKADPPLIAAVPPADKPPGTRRVLFRTNRASRPSELSRAFDIPWSDIVAWNALDARARLQPGQVLQVFVPQGFDAPARQLTVFEANEVNLVTRGSREHIEAGLALRGLTRRAYKSHRGDTLAKVARRFGLTVGDLARINNYGRAHSLSTGELVVVYAAKGKRGATLRAPDPVVPVAKSSPPSTARTAKVPRAAKPKTTKPTRDGRAASTADTARVPGSKRAR